MEFVWIALIGSIAIAMSLMLVRMGQRRRARLLKEAGTALGLRALDQGEHLVLPSVQIMRKRGRTVGGALEGSWRGESVMIFDLSYPAGKDVSRTTILVLRLSQSAIPEFAALRKAAWLYTPTVDLPEVEDAPQGLKSHWYLYAPAAQWPFSDEAAQFMSRNSKWSYEGHGSGLFVYERGKRANTKDLKAWIDEAFAEAEQLRRHIS